MDEPVVVAVVPESGRGERVHAQRVRGGEDALDPFYAEDAEPGAANTPM